jgi:serine/threonine protein kinase
MDPEVDLESTQKQALSPESISWIDDVDQASQSELPLKDPFWDAASSISDRLKIVSRIGKGGMSVVYKAQHLVMNKPVAVKLLLPHLTSDPKSLKRFQLEAQATANLNHANIVRVYDCGMTQGQAFIIMDFIDGLSLEQVIDADGKLPPERAIQLFVQLCAGINHAHDHNIIHRDLKPSNVMVSKDKNGSESVKVVDFGIAKLLMDDSGETMQSLTQTGDVFGSPLYMSPEQCSGLKLDKRSDIYSAGCLMYEILSGRPPIVGKNFLDTMQKHITDLPKPFAHDGIGPTLAKRTQAIVFKCMAKDPSARYQSIKEVADDLSLALEQGDTPSGVWKAREKSVSQIINKASRKSRTIKSSVIALLTISAISLSLGANATIAAINTPANYDAKPLFQIANMPKAIKHQGWEEEEKNLRRDLDKNMGSQQEIIEVEALETGAQTGFDYGQWKYARDLYSRLLKYPVGTEHLAKYRLQIGLCDLALNELELAKNELKAAAKLNLDAEAGYERGEAHPDMLHLLSGIHGENAKTAIAYLSLIAEKQNKLDLSATYAELLLRSSQATETELPVERAYFGDLLRRRAQSKVEAKERLDLIDKAASIFQKLKSNSDTVAEKDYKDKLCFALALCHLELHEPNKAVDELNEALEAGVEEPELLAAIDHDYRRALWAEGQYLKALTAKPTTKTAATEQ